MACRNSLATILFFALTALFFTGMAQAQFEIKGRNTNRLDPRNAAAHAVVSAGGVVTAITVRGGGKVYTVAPAVTIAAPASGTTATATAVLTGDVVTSINVTGGGAGYSSANPPAVFIAPPAIPSGSGTTTPQFAGRGITSATAGAISTDGVTAGGYPRARDFTVPASPVVTVVLRRATFGNSFASGVPRYLMGDEIARPSVRWDGLPVAATYWRTKPVQPGETFSPSYLGLPGQEITLPAQGTVNVTLSSTDSEEVTVASVPGNLTAGATLLGQRVNMVKGLIVTLAGKARQNISTSTATPFDPYQPFYYSPHANRVFATQPGRVTITWVSSVPDTSKPGEVTPTYKFRQEIFSVSSASQKPARVMYWTKAERGYSGPPVSIPKGRITRANPVHNSFVPGMTDEYVPVGHNPNPGTDYSPDQRTLWYEEQATGEAFLHAYNIEGRIFVEYLGAENQGTQGVHEFLGADIVEIKQVSESETINTKLGEKLRPRSGAAQNGDDQLKPFTRAGLIAELDTFTRPDGITDWYAEKESLDPDKVTFYWLETQDAAIHFLPSPSAPGLAIAWPKFKRNYTLTWPAAIADYQPVNVTATGSTVATGPQFDPTSMPQIVYQDDNTVPQEASIDGITRRLLVEWGNNPPDLVNRSLLKFRSADGPWYVRLWIESEEAIGSPEVADNPITSANEFRPAVYTLNDSNADGIRDWSPTAPVGNGRVSATVGTRLDPPSPAFATGGFVASGRCYSEGAYVNPFTDGVEAAGAGGIIPVNARPSDRTLKVWWFRKVSPPGGSFRPFYVPAVAAEYPVSYPASPQELVIASGHGIENPALTSEQASGSLYVQNNRNDVGYNPNEEHALMLTGNAYALRDDLNVTSGDGYSSEPFVLIQYRELGTNRPAMRAVKVVRANATYPLTYSAIAGTPQQPPMPLTALPLPLHAVDGEVKVKNYEVAGTPDTGPFAGTPGHYTGFTFEDRKGQHWIYRGPHNDPGFTATPTFGMKFFYYLRDGFYFPAKAFADQPAAGSIQPFIADTGAGVPVTVTYQPRWPDDPRLPVADQKVPGQLRTAETLTLPKAGLPQIRGQSSVTVHYQQSIAAAGGNATSVVLHDPTRAKTFRLGSVADGLLKLPSSVLTAEYAGKTWFQKLEPHLQNRFYFDPNLGAKGSLVLIGQFVDEIAGEDYLHLNVLSNADMDALKDLCPPDDSINKSDWDAAIAGLSTNMETFREYRTATVKTSEMAIGRKATATAVMSYYETNVFGGGGGDYLQLIEITDRGLGYLLPPKVVIEESSHGLDDTPAAEAVLGNNSRFPALKEVSSITLSGDNNFDDDEVPSVTIAAPPSLGTILAIPVSDGGSGYPLPPDVLIAPPPGGGIQATAVAELTNGSVTSLRITNPGSGYDPAAPPAVTIAPPPVPFAVETTVPVGAQTLAKVTDPDTAVDSYALSSTGSGTGYVTLVFNNGTVFTDPGDPVSVQIIKVVPQLYPGDLKVLLASNPLDEQVTLRHSGDYGGEPANFEFQWRYGFPNNGLPPAGDPATAPAWLTPNGTLTNSVLVGGSPSAVISTPAVIMSDTFFTMRYRKTGGTYSAWTPPQLVEGWIKRVLGKITPFNQRMTDLYNASVNTDVSLLTQAGTRWEGDIALNLNNINDAGLIEIYETVLNRGKSFTIGSGIDFEPANNALILAAGYLNDLYTILGNEAFADAANPTISLDDQTTVTEVNTSRFSFESQVASSLDEELALLKGRDDFGLPSVALAPAYNRLFWNYTRGINSGEALYAVNYNIREKAGSPTENGILDAADAQRMFPQGHGDAYGHYLTALTGYYKLLTHPQFTWTPSAESVTVLGQTVLVDYKDERKFAAGAANLARTAQQILALVHRQNYKDDPAAGWSHFRDGKVNTNQTPNTVRHQGLDEWASRAGQGNFLHWVTGNALLPDVDTNPAHTGVQIVDRTTVPELNELVAAADGFQSTMDLACAHLNPLGLSPGAIAFDISPAEHSAGNSHYEQIYQRALRSLLNAKGSFDQAAKMTRLLRNQENQIADRQEAIVDQEEAYVNQLIEIYGTPYAGDIGPGKTYAQGYAGPDLERWPIIDRPTDLVDTTVPVSVTVRVPTQVREFTGNAITDVVNSYRTTDTVERTFRINPDRFVQFSQAVDASGALGARSKTGSLQQALLDAYLAQVVALEANQEFQTLALRFDREAYLFNEMVRVHTDMFDEQTDRGREINALKTTAATLMATAKSIIATGDAIDRFGSAASEGLPKAVGLANDPSFIARFLAKIPGVTTTKAMSIIAIGIGLSSALTDVGAALVESNLRVKLDDLGFGQEKLQAAVEFEQTYRELVSKHYRLAAVMGDLQKANQRVTNLIAEGQRLLLERETFRQRAAAVIAGYRTKDLTFRTFRNEALEQYRTLFDLAARYSYLAAKSYDYETGLLGSTAGQAVINRLVSSRGLGDLTNGVPQATTSTLGDAGLAGTLAQMNADFAVAEGRLGINNPDHNGTLFSLRHELFRLLDNPTMTSDDEAWQQTLEQFIVPDLLADADVAERCNNLRKTDGSPVPGILIPFGTTIEHGKNFFGLDLAVGDHNFSASRFSTKISSVGLVLKGYQGMDPYAVGTPNAGGPNLLHPDGLAATPYVYFIPCGQDFMRAPPLGAPNLIRSWTVADQALPLPYNLGASDFNTTQFFTANGTLTEQPWILRKHQAFRPVDDPAYFYSAIPQEFTSSRLVGRSVWNGQWKIVIPAYTLLNNEQDGLNRFVRSVRDIQLFLRTYSHSGN